MLFLRVILKFVLELFCMMNPSLHGEFRELFLILRLRQSSFLLLHFLGFTGKQMLLPTFFLFGLSKILYMAILPLFVVLQILFVLFRKEVESSAIV